MKWWKFPGGFSNLKEFIGSNRVNTFNVSVYSNSLLCDKSMFSVFYFKEGIANYITFTSNNIYLQSTKINSESNCIVDIPDIFPLVGNKTAKFTFKYFRYCIAPG